MEPVTGMTRASTPERLTKAKAQAALRQQIWEASQFMGGDEIFDYMNAVLAEIYSDAV